MANPWMLLDPKNYQFQGSETPHMAQGQMNDPQMQELLAATAATQPMPEDASAWMKPKGMDEQQWKKQMLANLAANTARAQNMQATEIQTLKENLEDMRREKPRSLSEAIQNINWAPTLSIADQMNQGQTNYAGAYMQSGMVPPSRAERQKQYTNIRKALIDARRGYTQDAINASKEAKELYEYPLDRELKLAKLKALEGKVQVPPGTKAADVAFGKDVADYYYGGGKSTIESNLQRLQGAIDKLKTRSNLSGTWTTKTPGLSTDYAQEILNSEMVSVRDDIRGAIQGTLRATLGAQFTEKEGTAIFNRAFNPALSPQENVRRATIELNGLKRKVAQKDASMRHFIDKGTMQGFTPSGTMVGKAAPSKLEGMSDEDLQKMLTELEGAE